jgi:hypothetical protein
MAVDGRLWVGLPAQMPARRPTSSAWIFPIARCKFAIFDIVQRSQTRLISMTFTGMEQSW